MINNNGAMTAYRVAIIKISIIILQHPIRLGFCFLGTCYFGFVMGWGAVTSEIAAIAVLLTFVVAYVNNFYWLSELRRMPFPLTDKQVAWLPLGIWAALLSLWTLMFALGTCLNVHHPECTPAEMMQIAIVSAFFLLVVTRVFLRFIWVILVLLQNPFNKSSAEFFIPLAHQYWPWALLGVIYLIWDAPQVMHIISRCDEGGKQNPFNSQQDFTIPLRPTLRVALGNAVCVALIMLYVLGSMGLLDGPAAAADILRHFAQYKNFPYIAAGIGIALAAAGVGLWKRIRASGFSVAASVPRWLACSTGFGFSLAYFMGILSGKVSICASCRKPVMVWMEHCPHCEGQGVESEKKLWYQQVIFADNFDPLAMFYRVMIPVFLIMGLTVR